MRSQLHRFVEVLRSTDVDYIREVISRFMVDHRFAPVGQNASVDATMRVVRLIDIALNIITYRAGVDIELNAPIDAYFSIQIPERGISRIMFGNHDFESTQNKASVISPGNPLRMLWSPDCSQLVCRVERVALENRLGCLLERGITDLRFEPALCVLNESGARVAEMIRSLVSRIERGDSRLANPEYLRQFEESLLSELLFAQRHNYSDRLCAEPKPAPSKVVCHAEALMESDPTRLYSLGEVAAEVNTGDRTLQRGFQKHRDMTFTRYSLDLRYRRARDELRAAAPGKTKVVTDTFSQCGLPFNGSAYRGYMQRFGETPKNTNLRSR